MTTRLQKKDKKRKKRRASLTQHESTPLTTETVNNYFCIDEIEGVYEVPLYTAMKLQNSDDIDAILELNPDVFFGVKDKDKRDFRKTVAGLYLKLERAAAAQKLGKPVIGGMQNYILRTAEKLTNSLYEEWKDRVEAWEDEHGASSIDSIRYSYKKLKL